MQHIAIDLGSRQSQICVRDEQGKIVQEQRLWTRQLGKYLSKQPNSRVILETSSESFAVADMALEQGHQVKVVASTLVRALGVGQRGLKNDVRDARVLSEASARIELPSVHIPSGHARELKALNTSREALVANRTRLINRVRSYLRSRTCVLQKGSRATFCQRTRQKLLAQQDGLPAHIEAVLVTIHTLNEQIAQLDQELRVIASQDTRARLLMTAPGVGPVTATRFVAAIDTVERFEQGASLSSYLGLTPGENTTGFVTKRTRMTKAGNAPLRAALVQAAWSLWRTRPQNPMVLWAHQVANRRGKHIAVVALARRLAIVLYAMWRDQTPFDPSKTHARIVSE